ncbi:hypothetical protein [Nitrosopumilus sp.]|uniref:hypothetical protein n=1 Tax=Nitrosopumilus sp. TaxID=2024843 RepID=UPI0026265436|nr:hypothetical protein [Nitrosopumilus sp.]
MEIKKIVITNFLKTSVDELTKMEAVTPDPSLYWCNGFLFTTTSLINDYTIKKQHEGIMLLDIFYYALSEKISESKWNGYSIEVIDLTGHSIFEQLTQQIKEGKIE